MLSQRFLIEESALNVPPTTHQYRCFWCLPSYRHIEGIRLRKSWNINMHPSIMCRMTSARDNQSGPWKTSFYNLHNLFLFAKCKRNSRYRFSYAKRKYKCIKGDDWKVHKISANHANEFFDFSYFGFNFIEKIIKFSYCIISFLMNVFLRN